MAVAVKHKSETKTSPGLRQLPVQIVMGILYVLAALAIVFPVLDYVWWNVLGFPRMVGDHINAWAWVGRIAVGSAVAAVLIFFGWRLLGPEPARGLKAGIAVGVVGVLLVALLTQWLGTVIEGWVIDWTALGSSAPWVGIGLTTLAGLGLLAGLFWLIFNPTVDRALVGLEDQGWFTTHSYKSNQGQKVRRGTILGILIIVGSGIFALMGSLESMGNWTIDVPFTGKVTLTSSNVGANPVWRDKVLANEKEQAAWEEDRRKAVASNEPFTTPPPPPITIDRFQVRQANDEFKRDYLWVTNAGLDVADDLTPPGGTEVLPRTKSWAVNTPIPKDEAKAIQEAREARKEHAVAGDVVQLETAPIDPDPKKGQVISPTATTAQGTENMLSYFNLTLLPALKFSAPILLVLLGVWFAWRVVNMPTFGDFLIATEAELNKVSWTTPKRLIQDTIVVLVTLVLLTFFLFFADIGWGWLLKLIGVLQEGTAATKSSTLPW